MTVSCHINKVTCVELVLKLKAHEKEILLLDTREFIKYSDSHIKNAENIFVPKLLKRRSKGCLKLDHIIQSEETRENLHKGVYSAVVVYDSCSTEVDNEGEIGDNVKMIMESLVKEPTSYLTTQICFLEGGFRAFSEKFPDYCTTPTLNSNFTLMCPPSRPLRTLTVSSPKMTHTASIANRCCPPSPRNFMAPTKRKPCLPRLVLQDDINNQTTPNALSAAEPSSTPFGAYRTPRRQDGAPVQLLPYLYLGNACHSSCWNTLKGLEITAVMNVSVRCGNHFPNQLKYKNIPVADDTDTDLSGWFYEAASFIDSVKESGGRVLVHCKAGISRSATICMAYLMISRDLRVEDAFEFVHRRRAIISPNLAFMLQLHVLEKELAKSRVGSRDEDLFETHYMDNSTKQITLGSCTNNTRSISLPSLIVNYRPNTDIPDRLKDQNKTKGFYQSGDRCFDNLFSPHFSYSPIASPS